MSYGCNALPDLSKIDPNRVEAALLIINIWGTHTGGGDNVWALQLLNHASAYLIWGECYKLGNHS